MSNEIQFKEVNPEFTGVLKRLEEINQKCEDNMKRLNAMMLELKGIVAMVRPQVKKTGWYGEEVPAQVLHRPDGTTDYPALTKIEINIQE